MIPLQPFPFRFGPETNRQRAIRAGKQTANTDYSDVSKSILLINRTARIRKLVKKVPNRNNILNIKNLRTTLTHRLAPSGKNRKALRPTLSHLAATAQIPQHARRPWEVWLDVFQCSFRSKVPPTNQSDLSLIGGPETLIHPRQPTIGILFSQLKPIPQKLDIEQVAYVSSGLQQCFG
jgi:hypothetical protein